MDQVTVPDSTAVKNLIDILKTMSLSVNRLPHPIPATERPDPNAAQALQEGLGGQFGEMRTMMQYFFQNMNFRGGAKPYQDLLRSIATEEMGHVEQVANTINMLLEDASKPSQAAKRLAPISCTRLAQHTPFSSCRPKCSASRCCRKPLD